MVFSFPARDTRAFGRLALDVSVVVTINVQSSCALEPKSSKEEYVSSVFFTFS